MPRIIHTADVHFDTPFSANFDRRQARMRRNEIKNTFSAVIRRAKDADILLIAGDLFDSAYAAEETVEYVRQKFAEIPDTEVFVAAGNHDPLSSGIYANLENSHVHIFPGKISHYDLPQYKTRVHGISFSDKHEENAADITPNIYPGWCNIMVLHGDAAKDKSLYRPIGIKDMEKTGADYIALGHIHCYSGIKQAGTSYYAYPGVPAGRGFDECGKCGVIEGEVLKGAAYLEFVPMPGRRFFVAEVSCSIDMNPQNIADCIAEKAFSLGDKDDFYRIILTGKRSKNVWNTQLWMDEIKDLLLHVQGRLQYLEIEDCTKMEIPQEFITENPLVQEFAMSFDSPPKGEEALYSMAREIGLEALAEKEYD